MTAALEGGEWSAARPGRTLPPGKTRYPLYRTLSGPQGRSGRAENLVTTGIRSRTFQLVVSRYTDWATRPTTKNVEWINILICIILLMCVSVRHVHWKSTDNNRKNLQKFLYCQVHFAKRISNIIYVHINIQLLRSKTASVFDLGFSRKRITKLSHFKCLRSNTTVCRGQRDAHEMRVV